MTTHQRIDPFAEVTERSAIGVPLRPPSKDLETERRRRKTALIGGYRLLSRFGLDEGVAGHITARDPEHTDQFWTARWGAYFGGVTLEDLLLVNEAGEVVEGTGTLGKATFAIHAAIHDARPDVIGAVHAHGLYGKSFSTLGRELSMMTQDACAFYDDHVRYDAFEGVVFDSDEGRSIASALGHRRAAILANHGHLCVGTTVESAIWWFITMERSMQAELLTRAVGEPSLLPDEVAKATHDTVGTEEVGWFQFQSVIPRIIREQPDFAELWRAGH